MTPAAVEVTLKVMLDPTPHRPPPTLQCRLDTLQRVLTDAKDFTVPFEHFDVHIAPHPELWSCSRDAHNPSLVGALRSGVSRIAGTPARLDLTMFEVRGADFWHGLGKARSRVPGRHGKSCRKMLYYFFFARAGIGLVGVGDPGRSGGVMHLLRFHAVTLPESTWMRPDHAQA